MTSFVCGRHGGPGDASERWDWYQDYQMSDINCIDDERMIDPRGYVWVARRIVQPHSSPPHGNNERRARNITKAYRVILRNGILVRLQASSTDETFGSVSCGLWFSVIEHVPRSRHTTSIGTCVKKPVSEVQPWAKGLAHWGQIQINDLEKRRINKFHRVEHQTDKCRGTVQVVDFRGPRRKAKIELKDPAEERT